MRRSRVGEMSQKQSTRGPPQLRTSSSNSDPLHHRSRTERSRKQADGQSPRGAQSDPGNKQNLGMRISDLESHLGQAQEELKSLKDQLALGKVSKYATQKQVEKKPKKQVILEQLHIQENDIIPVQTQDSSEKENNDSCITSDENQQQIDACRKDNASACEASVENQQETDIFEVPVKKATTELMTKLNPSADECDLTPKSVSLSTELPAISESENLSLCELVLKSEEVKLLKEKLAEKEKGLDVFRIENESLKNELSEKSQEISLVKSKGDEINSQLNQVEQELERSKSTAVQLKEKLEAAENAKDALENEMKKLQIITEQWRKAADAAASVLAGDVGMNGRKPPERCGSTDSHINTVFKPIDMDSQGIDDSGDVYGSGKRKGSGIRIGDLWKKIGQK